MVQVKYHINILLGHINIKKDIKYNILQSLKTKGELLKIRGEKLNFWHENNILASFFK